MRPLLPLTPFTARGALICASFGSAWMFWAAAFVPAAKSTFLAFVTVMTVLIGGWAVLRVRAARGYKDTAVDREQWASIAALYRTNTVVEWVLAAGAVIALAHFRQYSLIPQFLGVIIGSHFVVLARLLREPRYYGMGAVIILCTVSSILVPASGLRNTVCCAGIGLPMWVTAVVILSLPQD